MPEPLDCGSQLPLSLVSLLTNRPRLHSRLWQQSGSRLSAVQGASPQSSPSLMASVYTPPAARRRAMRGKSSQWKGKTAYQ